MFARRFLPLLPQFVGTGLGLGLGVYSYNSNAFCESPYSQGYYEDETEAEVAYKAQMKEQKKVIYGVQFDRQNAQMKLFSGTANVQLAGEVAQKLKTKLSRVHIIPFADGEIGIQILENVRGKDVYIIQPTCPPGGINNNLMELILLISTMRRASAGTITAVLPYYGYARQDRKMQSRVPISAADVARLLESMGVDRVIAVDLHCGQIQGFFGPHTPCDNLDGSLVALPYFKELDLHNPVIVSPDAGGVYRAKRFRDSLNLLGVDCGLAMIVKQRIAAGKVGQMDLVGDVDGRDCIIVDDMIDTAGTLCKAGNELKRWGAGRIFAFATHGLLTGPAVSRIEASAFEEVIVTNSIPISDEKKAKCSKIKQISIAGLLAKAIYSVHFKCSISELFRIKVHETQHPVDRPTSHLEQISEGEDEEED